jgi:hypothetical protein
VLLSGGSAAASARTKLVVLAANTLAPLAEATVDVPVPLGYHGSFARAA